MMTKGSVIVFCFCLANVASGSSNRAWTVRSDGIGPVRIGMTLTQASSALHESFPGPRDEEERGCYYVHPKLHPDLFLMLQKRHVVRIDIDGANTRTSAGIRIGDPVEKVNKVYGAKVEVEPNFYDDQEKYLTVRSPDKRYAVRFETSFGKIAHLYAGRRSAVSLVEGCQ